MHRPPGRIDRKRWMIWLITGLFIVAGTALISDLFEEQQLALEVPDEVAGEPDLHIEGARVSQYRLDGTLKYRLESAQVRHFEAQQLTRLVAPQLYLYDEPDPPWEIRSKHGTIRQAEHQGHMEEEVYLEQDVYLEQREPGGNEISLSTQSLTIYPDSRYAKTDQDVIIESNFGRTTAVGLNGDLQRGRLNLFSDATQRVHTIVLPGQFK